jgi:hypothetical protein
MTASSALTVRLPLVVQGALPVSFVVVMVPESMTWSGAFSKSAL